MILASNSPRRKELLSLGGWNFKTSVSLVDENPLQGENPAAYVVRLAEAKARASAFSAAVEDIILAADTTVVDNGDILGKPDDKDHAVEMLKRLRGRTHRVFTGVALLRVRDGELLTDIIQTDVPMRAYSDDEIKAYVNTGDPLDKAGAYAIQHPDFHPVASMSGCFASVMGLPLCHVTRLLKMLDVSLDADIPAACQAHLQYNCPIFESVLAGKQVG